MRCYSSCRPIWKAYLLPCWMRWAQVCACLPATSRKIVRPMEDAGFTFRRGDAADLAERLRFLLANPSVREAAGASAKRRIREQYQWTEIAGRVERELFRDDGLGVGASPRRRSQALGWLDLCRGYSTKSGIAHISGSAALIAVMIGPELSALLNARG